MNAIEAQEAILAYLAQNGPIEYGEMLAKIEGISPDRMAHWLFSLRKQHKLKMSVVAQRGPDGEWVYTHTVKPN